MPGDPSTESQPTIEHLFGDQRPFAQCHASTIVALESGETLAAYFGGTREGDEDVAIWASRRDPAPSLEEEPRHSGRWSEPVRIAKISDEPHWNPVLFALSPSKEAPHKEAPDLGDLILHFKVGHSIRRWVTWFQRSRDGGRTWGEARPLVAGDQGGRGAVRNKPILLASGAYLAGASIERWRRWDSFFDRSATGVDDWVATKRIEIDRRRFKGKGLIQPTLWESERGHVHALFRSTYGQIHRADSSDDGLTWSASRPIDLPNNNSGIDLAFLPDGTLALACNPVPGNWAARSPLSILFSRDNGRTWPHRIDIETASGEFSYPAILAVRGGLELSYTWNRRRIAFARIPQQQIEAICGGDA